MSIVAYEGAAGCGKTFKLIQKLEEKIAIRPVLQHERVLALTYMHGSRKRLANKLSQISAIKNRYECLTIDSLAALMCRRWATLLRDLGGTLTHVNDYDGQCANACILLQVKEVAQWFQLNYPFVLIDEAQDLTEIRTRLISEISKHTDIFIALDEFQCLDAQLRPNPATLWLGTQCTPSTLTVFHRTNDRSLLNAAGSVREARAPVSGDNFTINSVQGMYVAAAAVASAIAFGGTGDVAIITPSLTGDFAQQIVDRVSNHECGKRKLGPYKVKWEQSDKHLYDLYLSGIPDFAMLSYGETLEYWKNHPNKSEISRVMTNWIIRQKNIRGINSFSTIAITDKLEQVITRMRQFSEHTEKGFKAMTVHQAKNREFDGVIVLWPYTVAGDAEAKRRLLYNAITRAKKWCKVFVQNPNILNYPPFAV